jgi:Phosphodiester glycosidase
MLPHAPSPAAPRDGSGVGAPERPRSRRARRSAKREARRARSRLNRTLRRTALVLVLIALASLTWSVGAALAKPTGDPTSTKLVEWVRDHGGNGLVNRVENWWYTNHPPPVGGLPKGGKLPTARHASSAALSRPVAAIPAQVLPPNISPFAAAPLPHEGVWAPTGKTVNGKAAVYEAFLRPDPIHTSEVVGAVWMDAARLRGALYNGIQLPGGGPWANPARIAPSDYPGLVAGFNSGFKLDSSLGGYYTEGKLIRPLVDGRASLVIFTDGSMTVGVWGRDVRMGPNIASVRQNLNLLVDGAQNLAAGDPNDTHKWGATLGGKVFVWRSGVGIDAHGNLIYVGGPALNIGTLADVLIRAGAVRAMELDINVSWVSYFTYTGGGTAGPIQGTRLLPNMERPPDRYLTGNSRDFIGLFAR